ncbi:MAG: Uma2 family endonuclease, partial [Gemmataceae bacterium]
MPILITDPYLEKSIREQVAREQPDRVSEVWDGVEVMSPLARFEHQSLSGWLGGIFLNMIDHQRGDRCLPGANITDQPPEHWLSNYRIPDVLVMLEGGFAQERDTHIFGGPDLVVEVLSPGEDPTLKFDFYAAISVRELLIVDLAERIIEIFSPVKGKMKLIGRSDQTGGVARSTVLPVE